MLGSPSYGSLISSPTPLLDTLLSFIPIMAMRHDVAGLSTLVCASIVTAFPRVTVEGVTKRASCAHGLRADNAGKTMISIPTMSP